MKKINLLLIAFVILSSCKTSDTTILNVDPNAEMPLVQNNRFVVTEKATNKAYGYTESLPINLGFSKNVSRNKATRYLDALSGPNQETITYTFIESCCPFISKTGDTGTGLLDKYQITWDGNHKPLYLYINIYEKGKLLIPTGLTAKK